MSKESIPSEKEIELHHPDIEEIMGEPPTSIVAIGSAVILIILLGLFTGSLFITYPDKIDATATLYGKQPLDVLIAPVSGKVNISASEKDIIRKDDTILEIHEDRTTNIIPLTALYTGILEVNPLLRVKSHIQKNDTLGFIWDIPNSSIFCSIRLLPEQVRNIKIGSIIRVNINQYTNTQHEIIEMRVQSFNNFNSKNDIEIISLLPIDYYDDIIIKGELHVPVEIIIGEHTIFKRFINHLGGR